MAHKFSVTLSTRTIYNYIENDVFLEVTNKDLPRQGKQKKRRYQTVRKRGLDVGAKSITDRPEEVEAIEEIGHWEMDCVESPRHSSGEGLLTLVERKSRSIIVRKLEAITQKQVIQAIDSLEETMGTKEFQQLFQSITVDNGGEFLNWQALETSALDTDTQRTALYYCPPTVLLNVDQMNTPMGCSDDTSRRDPTLVITLQKLFKKSKTGRMTIREEYLMDYQLVKNYKKIILK